MSAPIMADTVTLDDLDKQIVRCLQLRPRAAFSRIGAVLTVSEQTVARRYRRLQRAGVLRVIAAVDPRALGQSDWLVRIQSRPDATLDLGRALSQRHDVAWVSVSAGGSELVCAVRSHTRQEREQLLLDRLPRTASVLNLSASVVLRRFAGGSASDWVGVRDVLTLEQQRRMGTDPAARNPRASAAELDAADYALLEVLSRDGRASFSTLARAAQTTEGRVTRRLARLFDTGAVYLDVDLAGAALGFPTSAYLWLTVAPAHLEATCTALAEHDEAPFVAALSGPSNVVASVTCRDLDELYQYVTAKVGAIDGVQNMEISPVLRRLKQAGALVDGDRLADPSATMPVRRDRRSRPGSP
jgi:DNA-binding Lrp family transcriptional regulator